MNIRINELHSSYENNVHNNIGMSDFAIGLIYSGESHKDTLIIPLVIIITNKGKLITL
jgi:hypothetical protein